MTVTEQSLKGGVDLKYWIGYMHSGGTFMLLGVLIGFLIS